MTRGYKSNASNLMIISLLLVSSFFHVSYNEIFSSLAIGCASAGYIGHKMYCRFQECCNDNWIPSDVSLLLEDLQMNVFGQPHIKDLAKLIVGHAMTKNPNKPLVISLHGPTGTGKNYAISLIINHLFRMKRKSRFVKMIIGSHDYFDTSRINEYRQELLDSIAGTVASCPMRSLIVIDEADKLPNGLLDYIKPLTHTHETVGGVDYRKTIFVFISNSGQEEIGKLALEYANKGKDRRTIKLIEAERILRSTLFNQHIASNSGFFKSSLIDGSEIDHYLAFFPLTKEHVKQCIIARATFSNISSSDDCVEDVISRIEFVPENSRYFSATGCKKVNIFVDAFC